MRIARPNRSRGGPPSTSFDTAAAIKARAIELIDDEAFQQITIDIEREAASETK